MVEQLSQVCAVMVQVWPSGQAGQVGTESHVMQRLKREREGVKPSIVDVLVEEVSGILNIDRRRDTGGRGGKRELDRTEGREGGRVDGVEKHDGRGRCGIGE